MYHYLLQKRSKFKLADFQTSKLHDVCAWPHNLRSTTKDFGPFIKLFWLSETIILYCIDIENKIAEQEKNILA